MQIQIGTFAKDDNSTKRPTGLNDITVELKQDTSIIRPVFRLSKSRYNPAYNYCYVPQWHRYYYIADAVITIGEIWEIHCVEDFLATWRDEIANTTAYIYRTSVTYDSYITDDLYPTFQNAWVKNTVPATTPYKQSLSGGRYVVGIVNNSDNAIGAVAYYVFTQAQFRTLCKKLMENTQWLSIPTDIASGGLDDNLLKALFNPFQYVVSCRWYPFEITAGASVTNMPYGWWNLNGVSCSKLPDRPLETFTVTYPLEKHPQELTRGKYLNGAPFTKIELDIQPFGLIPIDANLYLDATSLRTNITVDYSTGVGLLYIYGPGNDDTGYPEVSIHHAQIGVDIQLAQIAIDRLTQAETIITGAQATARDVLSAASTATSITNAINPVAGGLGAASQSMQANITATHAIADGIRSSVPSVQIGGAQGSLAGYTIFPHAIFTFYYITDEDNANEGRPLCKVNKPANLGPGFYQFRRGDVIMEGNADEKSAVYAYLVSGFKYE